MKRIIGTFVKQAWAGPKQDQAMTIDEVKFDATRAVLSTDLEDIHKLSDDNESTDQIGRECVDWNGPCFVRLVDSIVWFFDLDRDDSPEIAIETLTQEQLDAARAKYGSLSPNNATLLLSIEATYSLNGEAIETMRENLEQMVKNAIGNGMLTGNTAAEVDTYKFEIVS